MIKCPFSLNYFTITDISFRYKLASENVAMSISHFLMFINLISCFVPSLFPYTPELSQLLTAIQDGTTLQGPVPN